MAPLLPRRSVGYTTDSNIPSIVVYYILHTCKDRLMTNLKRTLLYRVYLKHFEKLQECVLHTNTKEKVHKNIFKEMSSF
jgi:hypothetical protein